MEKKIRTNMCIDQIVKNINSIVCYERRLGAWLWGTVCNARHTSHRIASTNSYKKIA